MVCKKDISEVLNKLNNWKKIKGTREGYSKRI